MRELTPGPSGQLMETISNRSTRRRPSRRPTEAESRWELGGPAARIVAQCPRVALNAHEEWRPARESEAVLLEIEEGFVLVGADALSFNRGVHCRRAVVATAQPGMLLPSPGAGERLEALTACRFSVVAADSLRRLLQVPVVAEAITDAFIEAVRLRQASIRNCTYVRHSERVRQTLLQLSAIHGRVGPRGVRIDFPLTHQLLADMVGSARETVSLALAEFVRDGFVERHERKLVVRIGPDELPRPRAPDREM